MLASWADAIDNTHDDTVDVTAALVDSDEVSSAKASSDSCSDSDAEAAAFLADADFAVAVARAAELSGLTVVGSTVTDPNTQREKGRSDNTLHREAEKKESISFCLHLQCFDAVGWVAGRASCRPTNSIKADCTSTRGHCYKLYEGYLQVNMQRYFFTNRICDIWNALRSSVVEASSLTVGPC